MTPDDITKLVMLFGFAYMIYVIKKMRKEK